VSRAKAIVRRPAARRVLAAAATLGVVLVGLRVTQSAPAFANKGASKPTRAASTSVPATGEVFVSGTFGQVLRFMPDPAGSGATSNPTWSTPCKSQLTGSAFDSSGNFYVTCFYGDPGYLYRLDPNGALFGTGQFGGPYPAHSEAIVFDGAGDYYVGSAGGGIIGEQSNVLMKFHKDGTWWKTYSTGRIDWFDLASDQCTIFFTAEDRSVRKFDVCNPTSPPTTFASLLGGPNDKLFALRVLPGGDVLVADSSQILRLSGTTGLPIQTYGNDLVQTRTIGQWFALNLDPDGQSFWSADFLNNHAVYQFKISDGSVMHHFSGSTTPGGLAIKDEITAARLPKLIVKKVTDPSPDLSDSFAFTAGGGLTPTSFSLKNGEQQTFDNLAPQSGGYSIAETTPTGWTVTSSCDNGSAVTNITIGSAETVTCTFTNTKQQQQGTLIVKKVTVPNPDPSGSSFAFTTGGLGGATFSLKNGETRSFTSLAPQGGYSVAETTVAGWTLTSSCDNGNAVSNITITAGQTVTCTFTNTRLGTLVIKKKTVPSPDLTGTSFAFTTGGLAGASFNLKDGETKSFTNLAPQGGYSVAETTPAGWVLTTSCDNGNTVSNITIGAAETVTCTFTNTKLGKLVITKKTVPSPDLTGSTFAFTTGGLGGANFLLKNAETKTFDNLTPQGGYSVAEISAAGWILTSSCDNGNAVSSITITGGQTVTCTFTNTQVVQRGTLIIKKKTVPSPDPTGNSYPFATGGLGGAAFSLKNDESKAFPNITAQGGYSVTENAPAGWAVTTSCDNGSPVTSITVAVGQTVTCTFSNTKLGKLVITKRTVPNPDLTGSSFAFSTGGLGGAGFSLKNGDAKTFEDLAPRGGYSVTENTPAGWAVTRSCDNGNPLSSITIAAGQTVTCTFTNTATPRALKESALASLRGLLPGTRNPTRKRLTNAISHLKKSLNPKLWVDNTHLTKKGNKVFEEEKNAAHQLMKVQKTNVVANALRCLIAADDRLASIELAEAVSQHGKAKMISDARKDVQRARASADASHAIDDYKHAWEKARQA
jgi:hypothetical protein